MNTWIFTLFQITLLLVSVILASFWAVGSDRYNYEALIVIASIMISLTHLAKKKWGISSRSSENIGVNHYMTGIDSWKLGLTGYFLRLRGVGTIVVFITILSLGLAYWQRGKNYDIISLNGNFETIYLVYLSLGFGAITYFLIVYYVRWRSRRSLEMKENLHRLLHKSRDEVCELISRSNSSTKRKNSTNIEYERKLITSYSNSICDIISDYFKILTNDKTITCAIRLAYCDPDNSNAQLAYATVGRSSNLNPHRKKTSEPIPSNKGIPKFFSSNDINYQGVLFYDDLDLASEKKVYFKTDNDKKYSSDIKSLIVSPLNGWNGEDKSLIGLLYINSKTKKILDPIHTDLIAFTADTLSLSYTSMFSHLHNVKSMPEFN